MEHHSILRVVSKLLIPPMLVYALYVQFHGEYSPGGGFQAGVVFAAAFVLYSLVHGIDEFVVEGMPTVLPFHRHIVSNPAFVGDEEGFEVYTKWIEEVWDNPIEPFVDAADIPEDEAAPAHKVVVEVDGRRVEIALPGDLALGGGSAPKKKAKKRRSSGGAGGVSGDAIAAPMQGTVIKINVTDTQEVTEGEVILVLEAMKMENPVKAHKSGTVSGLAVDAGAGVTKGQVLLEIK